MAARIVHAFGSGVCEALPVQFVNDVYFLHEGGKRISYYTVALCLGSIGPLPAGYMLAAGYSWRLFFYVEFAFGMALLIVSFLFVEETALQANTVVHTLPDGSHGKPDETAKEDHSSTNPQTSGGDSPVDHVNVEGTPLAPPKKTYLQTLKPWSAIDHDVDFLMMMARSVTYFFVPSVLWVITSFGIFIGCAALAFNYTFPLKIVAPPYDWSPVSRLATTVSFQSDNQQNNSGLIAIAFIIGYDLAIPFANSSDRLAAYLTRRNNGIREAEMRLGVMLPAMIIGPAGLVVYGLTGQFDLHWIGYFAGVAMVDWAALFCFTFTLAYAVDSYNANISEMLIAMNIGKNAISFGMG